MCGWFSRAVIADLAEEALAGDRLRELRVKDLDRDVAIVLEIAREVDRRHAARAELALDAIPVGESRVEAVSSSS